MDFITKLPKAVGGADLICVVVDRFTKSAYFMPIAKSISSEKLAEIYIQEVVVRHEVPMSVVLDRDVCFTS